MAPKRDLQQACPGKPQGERESATEWPHRFSHVHKPVQKKREEKHPTRHHPLFPSSKKTVAATYSPTPPQGSTISVRRLHDRVRKETGYNPSTKPPRKNTTNNAREHPATCSGQALGLLVPVSSTPYKASTPGLSTPSSTGSLNPSKEAGDLISKQASRLDAFSGYPSRT